MKPIPLIRFDALAGYARQPLIRFISDELGWYEHASERVLGIIIRDRTDGDFSGFVFGRDRSGRYRWIAGTSFYDKKRIAEIELRLEMERQSALPDEEYFQGDEGRVPVDFFAHHAPEDRLHESFKALRDLEVYSAARGIIEPMMRWYQDADGNFIEQFQTTGFDSRIWELYLFAAFTELNFELSRIHAIPDLCCSNPLGEFSVEAVTVNASRDRRGEIIPPPPTETPDQIKEFVEDYMPIKFAGALKAKLEKKYWERPNVSGKPLIFAIQDFSSPGSMVWTRNAFERYILGYDYSWERGADGELIITPRKIDFHHWANKEVPSGFFNMDGSENVSAVLFSNSGTIAKFNRMGMQAGFGSERVRAKRIGTAVDHDPNAAAPIQFSHDVRSEYYHETWQEGIDIWHNPNARHPLDADLFPGVAHHWLMPEGVLRTIIPEWHPLGSITVHSLDDAA